jgi:hypothetical protein
MRTTQLATLVRPVMVVAVTAIAMLAAGPHAAAQERPPGLLNKLEVQTLVARGDPVDNDRLFAHFRVLWDRALTNAEQHESMAGSVTGNPNRSSGSGTPQHCTQLAVLERQSATTLRALTLYHKQLAEGVPATLPPGAARFEGGAGAPDPTQQELDALAARARSRTDHLALEEYLRTVATRHTRTADEHMLRALTFRGGRFANAAVHHEHLASVARDAARRATRAAEMQRQYAALGR